MKTSILITNYNYGQWLRRCIRSCINQTSTDYEIIIVDDASTDHSKDILMDYLNYDNIKVVYNKANVGIGESCKRGVSHALGKYIVRVDADDYIHEDFVKCLGLYASFANSHAVACSYQIVDLNEKILNTYSQEDQPIGCGILFRTDILELIGSYPSVRLNEDKAIMKSFNDAGFNMDYLNIPLYRYFKHKESLTNE